MQELEGQKKLTPKLKGQEKLAQKLDGQTKVDAKNERSKRNWHTSWKAKKS